MTFVDIMLYIFMAVAATSAIGILLSSNVFKAALLLLVTLLSLAAIFVMLNAEFLAVTQILIYAGGLVVVIIFGIMLSTRLWDTALKVENANIFSALLVSGAILTVMALFAPGNFPVANDRVAPGNAVRETGISLMTTFLFPFEFSGVLLLVSLIGAAVMSTNLKKS